MPLRLGRATFLIAAITAAAASASASNTPFIDPLYAVTVQSDVIYGTGSVGNPPTGTIDLRLDVYSPSGPGAPALRPAVVLIHGGGFSGGDKAGGNMVTIGTELASRGYNVASINYRLIGDDPTQEPGPLDPNIPNVAAIHAAMNDATQAVLYSKQNAASYDLDPTRLALMGSSAGAITSLGVGYQELGPQAEVGAVVSLWGTVDNPLQPGLQTDFHSEFDPNDPALFLTVGTNDISVNGSLFYESNVALAAHASTIGLPNAFFPIEGAGHAA